MSALSIQKVEEETSKPDTLETQMEVPTKKKTLTERSGVDMKGAVTGTPKKMMKKNMFPVEINRPQLKLGDD